jgi:RND family efflux transporter MFP subunit
MKKLSFPRLDVTRFVLFLCSFFFLPTAFSAPETAFSKHPALTVYVIHPRLVDWPQRVRVSGGIYPWQEAVVAAETGGLRITRVLADVGDQVTEGQELAELERDTIKANLAQQEAAVKQAEAALAEARANADRARGVRGTSAMSEQQINQYLIAEKSAAASVEAAQAGLKSIRIRLNQTRIVAPDGGVITFRGATLGNVVQPGSVLFRLIRDNRLEWRAEVAIGQIDRIRVGQSAVLDISNGAKVTGKVRLIAPTLVAGTHMNLVYVALPDAAPVRAGMYVTGAILGPEKAATIVPNSAVIMRDGYSYIFVVNGDNAVEQLKVKTGRRQQSLVEILTPLPADARIVGTGGAFLNDGDTVRVVPAPAQGLN